MPRQRAAAADVWRTLDERERACLAAAYAVDREQERAARETWLARGWRPPADTWRWRRSRRTSGGRGRTDMAARSGPPQRPPQPPPHARGASRGVRLHHHEGWRF